MKVCVFCASSEDVGEPYVSAVRELGLKIAERGHELVFGGYSTGLMRVVANAVREGGGKVCGVISNDVSHFKECTVFDSDELFVVPNIIERKSKMQQLAETYVIAPGSFGTFDELFNVLVELKMDHSKAPALMYNINGYFDLFQEGMTKMVNEGFMGNDDLKLFVVSSDLDKLLDTIGVR